MYNTKIPIAYLYFIEEKRIYIIEINNELRKTAIDTINNIRDKLIFHDPNLFTKNKNELCNKCSFFQTCLPFYDTNN
jgi:CRISPR/Cas system-associated exonuclease Cas4 (RecB family)